MTIAIEEERIRSLFDLVETVEGVALTLPEDDERRGKLLAVSLATLADERTIRAVIAARLLGLSERTVRAWAAQGVLTVAQRTPRLLLDLQSVHMISHLIREIRALGKDRYLLNEVWRRLNDAALLDRPELQDSVSQMLRGKGRVLHPSRGMRAPAANVPVMPTEVLATPRGRSARVLTAESGQPSHLTPCSSAAVWLDFSGRPVSDA